MSTQILIDGMAISVDITPDTCPVCHYHVLPKLLMGKRVRREQLQVVYQCTRRECDNLFISVFEGRQYRSGNFYPLHYGFLRSLPFTFIGRRFHEEVEKLSPNFFKIYNQAAKAEADQLEEICGPGYRKALEFLIKDYLGSNDPSKEEEIKKTPLGRCISTIPDANIKFCAERATWLGNDETHYIRKWDDKDLTHLKELIELTVNWIHNELLMIKYRTDMSEGK